MVVRASGEGVSVVIWHGETDGVAHLRTKASGDGVCMAAPS